MKQDETRRGRRRRRKMKKVPTAGMVGLLSCRVLWSVFYTIGYHSLHNIVVKYRVINHDLVYNALSLLFTDIIRITAQVFQCQ